MGYANREMGEIEMKEGVAYVIVANPLISFKDTCQTRLRLDTQLWFLRREEMEDNCSKHFRLIGGVLFFE